MKRYLLIVIVSLLCLCLVACSGQESVQNDEPLESQQRETALPEETPASVEIEKSAEVPQDEVAQDETDKQKILEFIHVLGLDDSAKYSDTDWFDIEGAQERNLLITILNISEDRFAQIEENLRQNGYTQPQEPTYVEKDKTRFLQYSSEALFMEIVYHENDMILNVHFMPQVAQ